MAQPPNQDRRPRILRPDPITQIGVEKERILKEMKKRLPELGIIVKIHMPAGTVMETTPAAALDHLVETGCPHMMMDFQERMWEVEQIFHTFMGLYATEKIMEIHNKAENDCRGNRKPN